MSQQPDESPEVITDLEKTIRTIRDEVDALQVASAEKRKPFYQNPSTIISITALLFSFLTTYLSNSRVERQDVQNKRQELRSLLQRLSALPKENLEVAQKYATDPTSQLAVSSFINQENTLLARQAAEVATALPDGTVSAIEYYAIGLALQAAYDLVGAKEFVTTAIDHVSDFNTEISARRALASMVFMGGNPESGRREYETALRIFDRYPGFDRYTVAITHVITELNWAGAEASIRATSEVSRHIQNAERLAHDVAPSPTADTLLLQIAQARQRFGLAVVTPVRGPFPPAGTIPSQLPSVAR